MGRGGDEDEVAFAALGEVVEELVAFVLATVGAARLGAGVRLIDHDQVGRGVQELVTVPIALDVVQADDGDGVPFEQALADAQAALELAHGRGQHQGRVELEALAQLALPLLGEVRGAQHAERVDLAAVEQLARHEQRLDGLADADVVGDEKPHGFELERHEQRHQLVGARLDRDAPEAAEGPCGGARRELGRVPQQPGAAGVTEIVGRGRIEGGAADVVPLEGEVHAGGLFAAAAEGTEDEEVVGAVGLHDPLAAAGAHQAADRKAHEGLPNTQAKRSSRSGQWSVWWKRRTL